MKDQLIKTIAICALITTLMSVVMVGQHVTEAQAKLAPIAYEYDITAPEDTSIPDMLNFMGDQGWEMINARRATGKYGGASYEILWKRVKGAVKPEEPPK